MSDIATRRKQTYYLTTLGLLTALVILLQVVLGGVKLGPVSVTFTMIPIVLGAMLLGKGAGAILGGVFGIVVIIMGAVGVDGFTLLLLNEHPVFTVLICMVKGIAAGFCAGLVYQLVRGNTAADSGRGLAASIVAACVAPVVNTGLFILGALTLVGDTLTANFSAFGWTGDSLIMFLIIACAGWNFVAEFVINVILSPALHRIYLIVKKQVSRG